MSVYQNKNLGYHDLLETVIKPPSKRKVIMLAILAYDIYSLILRYYSYKIKQQSVITNVNNNARRRSRSASLFYDRRKSKINFDINELDEIGIIETV